MKKMRVVLSVLFAVLLAFGCVSTAFATDLNESESNDTIETATAFEAISNTMTGKLESSSDVDFFSFTTENIGILTVTLTQSAGSNADPVYKVELLDENNKSYGSFSVLDNSSSTKSDFVVPAGDYYLKVSADSNWFGKNYKLALSLSTSGNFEAEDNNDAGKANAITLVNNSYSKNYIGSTSSSDVDWYSVQMTQAGYFYPYVKNTDSTSDITVKVYDTVGVNAETLLIGEFDVGAGETVLGSIIYVDLGKYYISVSGKSAVNTAYEIKVGSCFESQCEYEYNNNTANATKLTVGGVVYGNLAMENDVDYYKINLASSEAKYNVVVSSLSETKGGVWNVEVICNGETKTGEISYGSNYSYSLKSLIGDESSAVVYIKITSKTYSDDDYKISFEKLSSDDSSDDSSSGDILSQMKSYLSTFWAQFQTLLGNLDFSTMLSKMFTSIVKVLVSLGLQ